MRPRRIAALLGLAAALALSTTGCGAGAREDAANAVARRFTQAIEEGDGTRGCALLAPSTREELESNEEKACSQALPEQELPSLGGTSRVEVYGHQAQVVGAGDTLFLSDLTGGWRVVAAGCRPRSGQPYECTLKGG